MMDTDSLIPLLEFDSKEEAGYEIQGSVAEVFMTGTPVPESSLREGTPVDPSAATDNVAEGDGPHGGPQLTWEQREAVEQLLNIPISGDSPADKALEAARQTTLAERARLAQIEHNLIVQERALADNSRQDQQPVRSVVRRGQDINNNFAAGGPSDL